MYQEVSDRQIDDFINTIDVKDRSSLELEIEKKLRLDMRSLSEKERDQLLLRIQGRISALLEAKKARIKESLIMIAFCVILIGICIYGVLTML